MDLLPVIETDFIEETPEKLDEESDEEVPKEKIDQNEIFAEEPAPVIKPIKEVIEDVVHTDEEEEVVVKKVKKVKEDKPPKKKRVMTEAQLEHLKKGREKALAVRRANALEKKNIKELQTKKKQKQKKELEDYVNDVPVTPRPVTPVAPVIIEKHTEVIKPSMTEEQIEERTQRAIDKALIKHEEQRQLRKAKKYADQKKKKEQDKIHDMCVNASLYTKPPSKYGDQDFFDNCWN